MDRDEWSPADADLQDEMNVLAASMSIDPAFATALESRLQRARQAQLDGLAGERRVRSWMFLRPRLALGLGLAVVLSVLIGVPVLAQIGLLKYFMPYEVSQYLPRPLGTMVPFEPTTVPDVARLEQAVGFALLVPSDLPNDCSLWQYAYVAQTALLSFTCVDIQEQKALSDWHDNPLRQPVGPNAVQTLTINGQPAYYIEGTWQFQTTRSGTPTPPVWVPSGARRLVFERGDLLIDLAAIPASMSNGMASGLISKEALIQIAESMK